MHDFLLLALTVGSPCGYLLLALPVGSACGYLVLALTVGSACGYLVLALPVGSVCGYLVLALPVGSACGYLVLALPVGSVYGYARAAGSYHRNLFFINNFYVEINLLLHPRDLFSAPKRIAGLIRKAVFQNHTVSNYYTSNFQFSILTAPAERTNIRSSKDERGRTKTGEKRTRGTIERKYSKSFMNEFQHERNVYCTCSVRS